MNITFSAPEASSICRRPPHFPGKSSEGVQTRIYLLGYGDDATSALFRQLAMVSPSAKLEAQPWLDVYAVIKARFYLA